MALDVAVAHFLKKHRSQTSCRICSSRSMVGPAFSRHLEHAGGAEPRTADLLVHCHASILARACNFGLTRMAQLADLSYRQLAWCTTWYLREEKCRRTSRCRPAARWRTQSPDMDEEFLDEGFLKPVFCSVVGHYLGQAPNLSATSCVRP